MPHFKGSPPPWLLYFAIVLVLLIWAGATVAEIAYGRPVPTGVGPVALAVVGFLVAGSSSGRRGDKKDRTEEGSPDE